MPSIRETVENQSMRAHLKVGGSALEMTEASERPQTQPKSSRAKASPLTCVSFPASHQSPSVLALLEGGQN
ncbi:hypothetical protein NQZ68_038508 [Dissostichus eleginoides]|nr:hypothetical protein NQZ68_038508 [Dissostichus eleginoides]